MCRLFCAGIVVLVLLLGHGLLAQQSDQAKADLPREFEFLGRGFIPYGQLQAIWNGLPFDSITLERPSYRVTFHRRTDGAGRQEAYQDRFGRAELTVTTAGRGNEYVRAFPEKTGTFTGWIDIGTFARLSLLIESQGFATMTPPLMCNDCSSATVAVTGRVSRSVNAAGPVVPIGLWSIQEAIDSTTQRIAWKRK